MVSKVGAGISISLYVCNVYMYDEHVNVCCMRENTYVQTGKIK